MAIKRYDSSSVEFAISTAGIIAPSMFPRWGVPVDWMPVNILAMRVIYQTKIFFFDLETKYLLPLENNVNY